MSNIIELDEFDLIEAHYLNLNLIFTNKKVKIYLHIDKILVNMTQDLIFNYSIRNNKNDKVDYYYGQFDSVIRVLQSYNINVGGRKGWYNGHW